MAETIFPKMENESRKSAKNTIYFRGGETYNNYINKHKSSSIDGRVMGLTAPRKERVL